MKQLAKQIFLLLLLCLALTALGCTPAEEPSAPPPYPISEYADALTEACLKTNSGYWDAGNHDIFDFRSRLTSVSGKERGTQLYFVEVENNCTAYTCAYLHRDAISLIDVKKLPDLDYYWSFAPFWIGDSTRILTYIDSVHQEVIDPEIYPLTWYEIPLGETPPAFIGDLQLILVAIDRTITFTGLIEEEHHTVTMFYEDQSFYSTSWEEYFPPDDVANQRERLTAEIDYLWVQLKENDLADSSVWLPHTYSALTKPWGFLTSQNVNGTLYWMALENNLPDDMSLIEDLDYIDGWNEYYGDYRLYKVEDIVALHRE